MYLVRNFSNLLLNNYKMLRFLSESPKNTKKPTKRVRTNLHSKSINFCTFLGISQNGRSAIEETYRIESGKRHKAFLFAFFIGRLAVICGLAIIK